MVFCIPFQFILNRRTHFKIILNIHIFEIKRLLYVYELIIETHNLDFLKYIFQRRFVNKLCDCASCVPSFEDDGIVQLVRGETGRVLTSFIVGRSEVSSIGCAIYHGPHVSIATAGEIFSIITMTNGEVV